MNTTQISDVKKGTTQVNALYQGETKLWPLNDVLSGILQPENLVNLYTASQYYKTDGNDISVNSKGLWTDYITGVDKSVSYSHLTSADSPSSPGVRIIKSNISQALTTNTNSIYLRYRVSYAGRGTTTAIKFVSSDYYGYDFFYEKGKFTLNKYAGNSIASESILLDINPHNYHTYAFVFEDRLNLYIDGQLVSFLETNKKPSYIQINANTTNNISSTIETLAIYSNSHSPEVAKAVSDGITNKYRYQIIPPEKGLLLYDHGNQYEETTGGWALNSYDTWAGTICAHTDNAICLNGYNSLSYKRFCSTQPYNLFDFTPYTRLYFLVSSTVFPVDVTYTSTIEGAKCGYTSNTDHTAESGRVYTSATIAGITGLAGDTEEYAGLVCMDISGVNGMYTPFIADGAGVGDGRCTKVYKVWLA